MSIEIGDGGLGYIYLGDVLIAGKGGESGWKPGANTVSWYKLESDANDYSGNSRNGTGTGVSYTTVGDVKCAYFDNNVSHKIQIPGLGTFTELTMIIWVKTSVSLANTSIIFSLGPSTDNKNIAIQGNNGTAILSRWNGSSALDISDGTLNDNVWHCVIGTSSSTAGSKLYVDGEYIGANTTISQVKSDTGYSSIGGHATSTNTAFKYGGYLSNAIVENKVWTTTEISNYYNQTKGNYGL